MADFRALRPVFPILLGAALMLSLSLGIRQSLGLLAPQLTRDRAQNEIGRSFNADAAKVTSWWVVGRERVDHLRGNR